MCESDHESDQDEGGGASVYLAFVDVLTCSLGAAIVLFLMVAAMDQGSIESPSRLANSRSVPSGMTGDSLRLTPALGRRTVAMLTVRLAVGAEENCIVGDSIRLSGNLARLQPATSMPPFTLRQIEKAARFMTVVSACVARSANDHVWNASTLIEIDPRRARSLKMALADMTDGTLKELLLTSGLRLEIELQVDKQRWVGSGLVSKTGRLLTLRTGNARHPVTCRSVENCSVVLHEG